MSWTTVAPSLPTGSSWSTEQTSTAVTYNSFRFRVAASIARGLNNQAYVRAKIQVYKVGTGTVPNQYFQAQVSVNGGTYESSDTQSVAISSNSWVTAKTLYYIGSVLSGVSVDARLILTSTSSVSGPVTFTAPAYVSTYTITYSGNGNTGGSTAAQTQTYGSTITVSSNGFTKTGYTFTKWNTAADGSGTSYNPGATFTLVSDRTLYAIWVKSSIPVYINVNGQIKQADKAYIRVGNEIKEATIYVRVGNEIYELI